MKMLIFIFIKDLFLSPVVVDCSFSCSLTNFIWFKLKAQRVVHQTSSFTQVLRHLMISASLSFIGRPVNTFTTVLVFLYFQSESEGSFLTRGFSHLFDTNVWFFSVCIDYITWKTCVTEPNHSAGPVKNILWYNSYRASLHFVSKKLWSNAVQLVLQFLSCLKRSWTFQVVNRSVEVVY